MKYISDILLKKQSWKFYFIFFTWPIYLFILPFLFAKIGLLAILFIIFPGIYLFTWMAFLMHESWHNYVPKIPNSFFYNIFSWMLLTDPQIYKLMHGYHHMNVNSWDDTEFHPLGEIKNKKLRILYNISEIIFGVAFLEIVASYIVPKHPRYKEKYKRWKLFISLVIIFFYIINIGYISGKVFNLSLSQIIIPYIIIFWFGSMILHHSQLMEHGNLIVEDEWNQRNIWTRNLKRAGFLEKIFLIITHNDSREHVLHHTLTAVYSRPFPNLVPLPEKAVHITLKDYLIILKDMFSGRLSEF